MAVANGAEVKLYFSYSGALAIVVLGARVQGSPLFDQAMANTLGSGIKATFSSQLAAQMATTTSLVRVGVRDLRTDHLTEFRDTGAPVAGTAVGDPMPGQVALCITKRTARSGKSFRGRAYIGGYSEAANGTTGNASQAAADAATTFLASIGTNFSGVGLFPAVMTKPQEDVRIVETTTHADGSTTTRVLSHQTSKIGNVTDITSYESRNLAWETQRRRNNGRGALPSSLSVASSAPVMPTP